MALNPNCDVEVGTHEPPYWYDGKIKVCDRHRKQLDERSDEFGENDWVPVESTERS